MELASSFDHEGWTIQYALSPRRQPGKTVVFGHGTPWSSAVFQPINTALLARGGYQVLLYDLPGYGQSQKLDASQSKQQSSESTFEGDTSVALQARALTALLRHLKLDGKHGHTAPAVIAHDIAGTIALRAHLIHACEFSSLLLMDTNTVLPWGDGFYKLCRAQPNAFLDLPLSIFASVVRSVTRSACHNPKKLEYGWEDTLIEPWIGTEQNRTSFVRQIAQANDADVAEMLDQNVYVNVRCPVKVLWGEQDQWIPREKMEKLVEMLGERMKEFVTIPEAGHLIMIDQPERVAIEVFEWLARQ